MLQYRKCIYKYENNHFNSLENEYFEKKYFKIY